MPELRGFTRERDCAADKNKPLFQVACRPGTLLLDERNAGDHAVQALLMAELLADIRALSMHVVQRLNRPPLRVRIWRRVMWPLRCLRSLFSREPRQQHGAWAWTGMCLKAMFKPRLAD